MPPSYHGPATNVAIQSVTAFSQTSTASSNARMKTSQPVSITMTPVPVISGTGSSTSQVPNTARMKSVMTSEVSSMFPHGVSANVTVRTKCSTPSSHSLNSQVHMVSSVPVLSSVSPSYTTSSVRNSPTSTNSSKLSSSQVVTSHSVPNRKKSGSDVTIAKVSNLSGKSSPNFQSERQLPLSSVKQKLNVERRSPKTLDLSSSSVNRSVTVSSIPSNPSKAKSSPVEFITTSGSVQKPVTVTSLPLMNIPDCISVTPSLPSPSQSSVTTTVSPSVTTTPKSIMNLKQRILHDTNLDQPSTITKVSPTSTVMKADDDGIEVIEIVKDARKTEGSKVITKPVGKSENVTQQRSELKKKKKEIPKEHVPPVTSTISAPIEQSASLVPPAAPCQQEREVERLLKEEEETAAAADFLSQINESLKNFPNTTIAGSRDIYHNEERLGFCEPETPVCVIPKIESLSPQSAASPSSDQRGNSSHCGEEKAKLNSSKGTDLKKEVQQITARDDEESVQIEVNRVMKELIELQGHLNTERNPDTVDLQYSSTKTKVPTITKTNCNSISVTVSAPCRTQQSKSSKQSAESSVSLSGRRSSTGNADLAKLSYGFQDEFQKHLFQETMSKQESEVPNSYKMAKSKAPVAFSQVNQTIVHSSIANRHNQNSSLEGR